MPESGESESLPTITELNQTRRAVKLGFEIPDDVKRAAILDAQRIILSANARDRTKLAASKLIVEMVKANIDVEKLERMTPASEVPPIGGLNVSVGVGVNVASGGEQQAEQSPRVAAGNVATFLAELRGMVERRPENAS